jgi:hypothetical protein
VPLKEDPTIRRSYLSKELVTSPAEGVESVADVLPWMVRLLYRPCLQLPNSPTNHISNGSQTIGKQVR